MPSAAPFDSLEDVLNCARVRLNDAIQTLGGEVLTDTAVFTLTFVNAAWARLLQLLAGYGIASLNRQTDWFAVPASTSTDYGSQVYLNWDNFFDGTGFQPAPVLPADMISPLDLYERPSGSTLQYSDVDQLFEGLPTVQKGVLNRVWEWRENAIWMPGTSAPVDLRLRYSRFLPKFVDTSTTPFASQPVQITMSLSPFAWLLCSEVAKARGDMDAGGFDQNAVTEAKLIYGRESLRGKSIYKRSEYGKMPDAFTPLDGPAGARGLAKGA